MSFKHRKSNIFHRYYSDIWFLYPDLVQFYTNYHIWDLNWLCNACSALTSTNVAPEVTYFYETALVRLAIPSEKLLMTQCRFVIHALESLLDNFSSGLFHQK